MMKEIYTALRDSRFSLIEAGTGTGKTLAYLLPSIYFAKKKEEPVIISTQTVQLQQQILEKEIPLLKKIMPFSFESSSSERKKALPLSTQIRTCFARGKRKIMIWRSTKAKI